MTTTRRTVAARLIAPVLPRVTHAHRKLRSGLLHPRRVVSFYSKVA